MPKSCCVAGCTTNTMKNEGLKFHMIPFSGKRRDKWLRAVNRCELRADGSANHGKLWEPKSNHTYVCGLHFIGGEKSNDETHPDYVPSIFPSDSTIKLAKSDSKMSRFNRKNERVKRKATFKKKSPHKQPKLDQTEEQTNDGGPAKEDKENSDNLPLQSIENEDNSSHVDPHESSGISEGCTQATQTSESF